MTDDEAVKLWNSPKCPRCEGMESRLRACLLANETWAKNFEKLDAEYKRLFTENNKLRKYVNGAWGQA